MENKIKVLFATTVFDNVENGPGTYARYLWEAFKFDDDIEFHIVVPESKERHPRIHVAGNPSGSLSRYKAIQSKAVDVLSAFGRFNMLHANSAHMLAGFSNKDLAIAVQVNDYEVVESFVNPIETLRAKGFKRAMSLAWRRHHEERVLKKSAVIIANSEYVKAKICDGYQLSGERCHTIYKSVDLTSFHRPEAKIKQSVSRPAKESPIRLIFIGSNWEIKGLDILLSAVRRLLQKNLQFELLIVGGGEHPSNIEIREHFSDLESTGVVKYLGRKTRSEIAFLLWSSDISVLPSRQEALGVSILESMAAGVPVVASRVGGIPEILGDSEYGLLFEPLNVEQLCGCIERLIESSEARDEFKSLGTQRVEHFSKDVMIKKIRDVYFRA